MGEDGGEGESEEETEANKRQDSLKVILRNRSVCLEWRFLENRRKFREKEAAGDLIWAVLIGCQLTSGGSKVKAKEGHIMYKEDIQFC